MRLPCPTGQFRGYTCRRLTATERAIMNPTAQETFSEADLDRLEELLDSEIFKGEAMLLDELQALLCAIISGPEPIPPSDWLPVVFGDDPAFESEAQTSEIIDLLMRFYNDLAERLAAGDDWELILYPYADDPEELDFATWADAYLYGSQLGCNWYDAVGDHAEELTELLQPLFLLSGMLKEDALQRREAWMSAAQEKLAIASAQEELPELVSAIHDFWRAKEASDEAISDDTRKKGKIQLGSMGETPAAGRNEACPCGSGKKYKQCCGSPEKLH